MIGYLQTLCGFTMGKQWKLIFNKKFYGCLDNLNENDANKLNKSDIMQKKNQQNNDYENYNVNIL